MIEPKMIGKEFVW